jgi:dTDP-4-dehydrorhamnose reductase
MKKILLFGKSGQVGWELQRSLSVLGEVIALDFDSTHLCGDFTNPAGLLATVYAVQPDIIVNAAAHTAVDKAESEPDLARTINTAAPAALAQAAAALGAWLVHYSTDYVFDGRGQTPWVETDVTAPLSVYGHTKREAEQLIAASNCNHLIFRTSWVYAARGGNFAKTMVKLAKERDSLSVINDQFGAPTGADLLADATAHALRRVCAQPEQHASDDSSLSGLYHLVAGGHTSWHGYAQFVIQTATQAGVELKVLPQAIAAVPTSSYPTPARRPSNSRLNTGKFQQVFGLNLPPWQQGVTRMLAETL